MERVPHGGGYPAAFQRIVSPKQFRYLYSFDIRDARELCSQSNSGDFQTHAFMGFTLHSLVNRSSTS
jgi:hypothetical protein